MTGISGREIAGQGVSKQPAAGMAQHLLNLRPGPASDDQWRRNRAGHSATPMICAKPLRAAGAQPKTRVKIASTALM
jgi:hypothetical protein